MSWLLRLILLWLLLLAARSSNVRQLQQVLVAITLSFHWYCWR
jgi:hypothetical protein